MNLVFDLCLNLKFVYVFNGIWYLFMFDPCFLFNVLRFLSLLFLSIIVMIDVKKWREIKRLKMNFTKGERNKLNKDERNKIQRERKIKWTKMISMLMFKGRILMILMLMFRGRILMKFWCFCLIDTLTKCCKTRPKNLDQFLYQNSYRLKYVKNSFSS